MQKSLFTHVDHDQRGGFKILEVFPQLRLGALTLIRFEERCPYLVALGNIGGDIEQTAVGDGIRYHVLVQMSMFLMAESTGVRLTR